MAQSSPSRPKAIVISALKWGGAVAFLGLISLVVAVAVAMAQGAGAGLNILLGFQEQANNFYPYHAARADLLRRTNQREAAVDAYKRALDLFSNNAERAYLQRRLDEVINL